MTNLERVALEIKTVGLYDLVLQDAQKIVGKNRLSEKEIEHILIDHPEILEAYKQTNIEYNLSNIHLRDIPLQEIPETCRPKARKVNENLALLRAIEKYTLAFEQSSTLVIIFSVEFFVLFSVQYFIVLLNLKEWQWPIYGTFALSIVIAWWYAKKVQKKYREESARYEKVYEETLKLLEELEDQGCVHKEDLWIRESEDHV
ncbi:hypothetical protein [Nitratifractor sp.]|uniref:hypothetical protein n=1 Tax=Nitratifractor sp. TaxID=2268144 RepID=UPI0025DFFCBC|nr:hypothetical protein [Nitratifractor sp.]